VPPLNVGGEKEISMAFVCGVTLRRMGGSGTVNTCMDDEDTTVEFPTGFDDFKRTI